MSQSGNSDKVYECQKCGKTFKQRTYLHLHEKIHGEKCYKCNICGKSFSQPAGLWIHKKRQTCLKRNSPSNKDTSSCNTNGQFDDEKRHKCDICNRSFSQKHLLTYHTRTHTGESPHSCTICGKMFRTPGALTVHQRTHNGQKPYKCIFCSACFTQRGPLLQHCRRIHSSDLIYECSICKEKFEKYRDLSSHKHVHSDVPCTMVKQLHVQEKEEDKLEHLQGTRIDVVSAVSPLNGHMFYCDSNKENDSLLSAERSCDVRHDLTDRNERHSTNERKSSYQKKENKNLFSSEESLSVKCSFKQANGDSDMYAENDNQDVDEHSCQGVHHKHCRNRSNDSGVSQDTSSLDAHCKCDEHKSDLIYGVYMQPIETYREGKENCPSQTTASISTSLQNNHSISTNSMGKCSKARRRDDELSNFSRVTPDNDSLISCCSVGQGNSFFEKKSENGFSSQFLHLNHASVTGHSPEVNNQKWKEDHPIETLNYSLVKNNNADFRSNSIEIQLDCSKNMKCSNVLEPFENQENFFKTKTLSCSRNSIVRISDDDSKMNLQTNGELEHQCTHRTGMALKNRQQNPKYEHREALNNGTQYICFKCDVLPASCHLSKQ